MTTSPHFGNNDKHIAVIGSGISGLSAAWLISQSARITLYESEGRLGGHANTVTVATENGEIRVDTGFIVYNEKNYPNLVALFQQLGVETANSDMSFAASLDDGRLEYSGTGLSGLFSQRRNILRPRFWSMVKDILRFYREAPHTLNDADSAGLTLGDYLKRNRYSEAFIADHLLPMGAAIWSASAEEMRAYPLTAFVRFFVSHGLMEIKNRPKWRTVMGGSQNYVETLRAAIKGEIRLNSKVTKIERQDNHVFITDCSGDRQAYSDVVIASHSDQALAMLSDATDEEQRLLGAIRYTANRAILHCDTNLMPKRKRAWSSWNYLGSTQGQSAQPLCVTYWMNKLQNIDQSQPLFVTLNPIHEVDPAKTYQTFDYEHPLFDERALNAQKELWSLQGKNNTWYCGAYFGYGFHEDGLQAGLAVAEALCGVKRPWDFDRSTSRITLPNNAGAPSHG